MPNIFTKSLFKCAWHLDQLRRTFTSRLFYGLVWKLDGSCKIEGPINSLGVGGNVLIKDGVVIRRYCQIDCPKGGYIEIGAGSSLNQGSFIVSRKSVIIGENVMIGEYSSIRDNDHGFSDATAPMKTQGFVVSPVNIEDDVWIGRNVVINKGVTVGRGAIIGAGAVVTKDIEPFTIVAGIPARVIRERSH